MNKISIIIVCKNEAHNIRRCLESVKWADEIVIFDTGSTDETLQICREYGCTIYNADKWEGFGHAKHSAVNYAKNDWVFSIDADEEMSIELQERMKSWEWGVGSGELNSQLPTPNSQLPPNGYNIKRVSFYMGKKIRFSGWQSDTPLKFFNKTKGNFNQKIVHESVQIEGKKGKINEVLYHYTYPFIKTHITKMMFYSELGAEQDFQKGKKSDICKAIFSGLYKFIRMYLLKLGFLDGKAGLILAVNSAFGAYLKYIYLWEKTKK